MATVATPNITAQQAQAAVNYFLNENLPDRFCSDLARFDSTDQLWHVNVLLAYPVIGSIGRVGEVLVDDGSGDVVSYSTLESMKQQAAQLYQTHRDEIEAAFL